MKELIKGSYLFEYIDRVDYWKRVNKDLEYVGSLGEEEYLSYVGEMGKRDIFFFMIVILNRVDANCDFVYEVCRDLESRYVENELTNLLHLYARGHYKSSIITMAYTIRDLMIDSDRTFCIFSNSNANAENRVSQIKREFETNELLKKLYPDVCWIEPERESSRWSVQKGIVLKRRGNPQEGSVEGWGILDGMPTGRHFSHLIYDDLVTEINVNTPEQIDKTTERWGLSLNLDAINKPSIKRYIGTRYHYADTYKAMMDRGVEAIIRPATKDGKVEGEPVLLKREVLDEKIKQMGDLASASQLFLNPIAVSVRNFQLSWVMRYEKVDYSRMNKYLIVDPAKEKTKKSDYTVMIVIGLHDDNNYYLLDGVRDKMGLAEKWDCLYRLHRKYKPLKVGYEEYGMQSDIDYMRGKMDDFNYRFGITKLAGKVKKEDRIDALQPIFQEGRMWLPMKCPFVDVNSIARDFVVEFLDEEYMFYPFVSHNDMLDSMARILESQFGAYFPMVEPYSGDAQFCNDDDSMYGF